MKTISRHVRGGVQNGWKGTVSEGLPEEAVFEQRCKGREKGWQEIETIAGRGNSQCKGPVVRSHCEG
jgi:hypothetical protein